MEALTHRRRVRLILLVISNVFLDSDVLQERKKVLEAEEALARRRRVVADLTIKSKATALQVRCF